MIKAIKNIYTQIIWVISRKIFLDIRSDSPSINLDSSEKNIINYFLENYNKKNKILFDIGANVGSWSKLVLEKDKDISLFAFEATHKTYMNLKETLNTYNGRNINISNKALSNERGDFNMYNFGENEGINSFFKNQVSYKNSKNIEPKIEKVSTTTIDMFCKKNNIQEIDYLKCDTEGNDFNVILGAKDMFKYQKIIAFQFEYNWRWINSRTSLKNIFDYFGDTNYIVGKITKNEIQFIRRWNPELEKFYEANYLIVHNKHLKNFKHNFYYFNRRNVLQIA